MKKAIFIAAIAAFTSGARAASFDCIKASSLVEKTICADSQLSALDDTLTQVYKKAVAGAVNPDALKSEQRVWLTTIRNKCSDVACLKSAYNERVSALSSVTSANVSTTDSLTGTYKAGNREMKIQLLPTGRVKFYLFAMYGMNTGEVSGEASLKGDIAAYVNREDDCNLVFKFGAGNAKVTQDGSCGMGLNVSGSGIYKQTSKKMPVIE